MAAHDTPASPSTRRYERGSPLRDGGRPEQVFQLQAEGLPSGFPPLRSLDNPGLRTNLPAQVSSFIGREAELAAVRRLVERSRLVTLTGAGGAGKTRLALQVAAGLVDGSGDGVWFADLAPLGGPDLVAVTVADVLGVRREPGRPVLDTLVEAVGGRRLLVLLDNCEHVIGACAKLADALLRGCPNLALLATSREPLGIDGEWVYRVPSLGVPADGDDAGAIRASEAVRLLEDRAAAQGVPLAEDEEAAGVAGRICRRLDGIPLAIELAAARLRGMPAAELEARLDQRFALLTGGSRAALPRQQTLRAMVEWSWELLNPAERAVLARLAVFTEEATLPRAWALAAAARLLQQAGGYAIAGDYCQEALAIARAVGDDYLVADLLQIRAWVLLSLGQTDAALPLIESGLRLARRLGEFHLTGRLLSARSFALDVGGSPTGAARDAAESLRLFRQAGDRLEVVAMLGNLGTIELSTDDLDAARGHLAEALDIVRALNDRSGIVYGTFNLGLAEYLGGSPDAAEALFAESLDLARRAQMRSGTAYALIGLALACHGEADLGWSARLHGAADQALADLGHTLEPLEGRLADLDRQRLRAAMGVESFEAEYAAGHTLDLASVLAALGRQDAAAEQARMAHEAEQGMQAQRAAQRPGALAGGLDAAVSGEAASVLTPRELDVLKLVAQGLGNKEIAARLVLSEHTVHRHLANILRKLDLSSRAAAAAWGVRTGRA